MLIPYARAPPYALNFPHHGHILFSTSTHPPVIVAVLPVFVEFISCAHRHIPFEYWSSAFCMQVKSVFTTHLRLLPEDPSSRPTSSLPLPQTDFTIAPSQNQRFSLTNDSWLPDTTKDATKNTIFTYLRVAKDCRTMTSRGHGAPFFRRYGPELVSKTAIS